MWFIFIKMRSSGSCDHGNGRLGSIKGGKQNKSAQKATLATCTGTLIIRRRDPDYPDTAGFLQSLQAQNWQRLQLDHNRLLSCPSQFTNRIIRSTGCKTVDVKRSPGE